MNKLTLDNDIINFKEIEKVVFGLVCNIGISILKEMLEQLDEELFKNRDTKEYRYKFKTEKTIQTVMGDLKYKRRYYIKKSVSIRRSTKS